MDDVVTFSDEEVYRYHKVLQGKLEVISKVPLNNKKDLSLAYTPGVAKICEEIAKDSHKSYDYTGRGNTVAVVSDGTAVLGLGDIGAHAAMPVMEGKCILFKMLAGVDALPICINETNPDKIVELVKAIEPSFGGINLEDISAPNCFKVENRLINELSIPTFHDDQHGTAVVALAGLINALKVVGKKISEIKVVVNGAGAAGLTCAKFYMSAGVKDIILCDSKGIIYDGRSEGMNEYKQELAKTTNLYNLDGDLSKAMVGADVFLGMSRGNVVSKQMVSSMASDSIVFPCANPIPEISPNDALDAGACIVGTGRSDFKNQLNNVLGFPGIFRGVLDVRATEINQEMNIAAAHAIASCVSDDQLSEDYILTTPLDPNVMVKEAVAVAKAAMKTGVATINVGLDEVERDARHRIERINRIFSGGY